MIAPPRPCGAFEFGNRGCELPALLPGCIAGHVLKSLHEETIALPKPLPCIVSGTLDAVSQRFDRRHDRGQVTGVAGDAQRVGGPHALPESSTLESSTALTFARGCVTRTSASVTPPQ